MRTYIYTPHTFMYKLCMLSWSKIRTEIILHTHLWGWGDSPDITGSFPWLWAAVPEVCTCPPTGSVSPQEPQPSSAVASLKERHSDTHSQCIRHLLKHIFMHTLNYTQLCVYVPLPYCPATHSRYITSAPSSRNHPVRHFNTDLD